MSINVKKFSLNSSGFSIDTKFKTAAIMEEMTKNKQFGNFHIYNYHSSASAIYFCTKNTLKHREISAIFKYIPNIFFNKFLQ